MSSTTTHSDAVGQLTPVGEGPLTLPADRGGSIRVGPSQLVPSHCQASPRWSTAMHMVVAAHETPANEDDAPRVSGTVHWEPSQCDTPPDEDMHQVADRHDTADAAPQSPLVRCQPDPADEKALPSPSTAAQ